MRKTWKQWQILSSWAPKSLQTVIETRKLKDMFLGEKLWQTILLFICLAGSTLYDSMDCSMSGFPVFHCLRVCSDSCPQSPWCHPNNLSSVVPFCSCPQSFPTSGSFPMSHLFSHLVAKVLELQLQHQSFQEHYGWFPQDWVVWSLCRLLSSSTPQFEIIMSLGLNLFYGLTLSLVHDYWKNHSFDYRHVTEFCWQNDANV